MAVALGRARRSCCSSPGRGCRSRRAGRRASAPPRSRSTATVLARRLADRHRRRHRREPRARPALDDGRDDRRPDRAARHPRLRDLSRRARAASFDPRLADAGGRWRSRRAWTLSARSRSARSSARCSRCTCGYVGREITVVLLALCAIVAGARRAPALRAAARRRRRRPRRPQRAARRPATSCATQVQRGAMPVLVLFFAAVGASMHVEALATVGVDRARRLGPARGAAARRRARRRARAPGSTSPRIAPASGARCSRRRASPSAWRSLVATEYPDWGGRLQTLMVAIVAMHELVGPIVFRAALAEVRRDRRHRPAAWSSCRIASRGCTSTPPDGSIRRAATPGGVSVALDALMRERGGVWVAHGAGTADRVVVDERSSIEVPPDAPAYRLRRLWLYAEEEERLLRRLLEQRALAALPSGARAPAVQGRGLGDLSGGQPPVRGGRRRSRRRPTRRCS